MKKNTQPRAKLGGMPKDTSLKERTRSVSDHNLLSNVPALSLVSSLESSTFPPSSKKSLPSELKSRVLENSLSHQSSLKRPKAKLTLAASVSDYSKESHVMPKKDQKKASDSAPNKLNTQSLEAHNLSCYSSTEEFKSPDVMDFYKGWISFYENQWQLFFKSWSQFLGSPGLSPTIFENQAKEVQHYYTCLASQFQECASIAQRTTEDTVRMMHGSSHEESPDSKSSKKNNAKSS